MKNEILEQEIQNQEKTETQSKKAKASEEDQYRVVISREANEALELMTKRTNDGFDGGEVTKSDIANFVFIRYAKEFPEADIKHLRHMYFDEKKVLRALLRKAGDQGALPEDLKRALREHYGLESKDRKTSRKASQDDSKDGPLSMSSTDSQDPRRTSN